MQPIRQVYRAKLKRIFRWAVAEGYGKDDLARGTLDWALPRRGRSTWHFGAMPAGEVMAAIEIVPNSGAWPGTRADFELLALTACRSGDVRRLEWREIDLASRTWTILAGRSKTWREHKVSLALRAVAVLDEARRRSHRKRLIFPSVTGKPLSGATLRSADDSYGTIVRDLLE